MLISLLWPGIELTDAAQYVAMICYILGHVCQFVCALVATRSATWNRLGLTILALGNLSSVIGVIFQVVMGSWCAGVNAKVEMGCPLPDEFNHNAVFHLIQTFATFLLFGGVVLMTRYNMVAPVAESWPREMKYTFN